MKGIDDKLTREYFITAEKYSQSHFSATISVVI